MSSKSPRRRFRRDPIVVSDRLNRYRRGASSATPEGTQLRAAWASAVGADIAANSVPVRRSRPGVITIACASSAWAMELDLHRDRHLRALTEALPELPVTGLRFVVGDHVMPTAEPAKNTPKVVPTDDELRQAKAAGAEVTDPELRDRVVRAAAGQLALARTQKKDLQRARKPGRVGREG